MKKFSRLLTLCILLFISLLSYPNDNPKGKKLAVDTAVTTVLGNAFIAPAEWSISVRGPATFIEAPEGGSRIVLVDVKAADADAAMAAGWAAYKTADWPLKVVDDQADEDGWSKRRRFEYQTSPNERRYVVAGTMFANGAWTIWIYDMADDVGDKRGAQVSLLFSSLLPKGYDRETFRGREPHQLDAARIAKLSNFVIEGQKASGVPGVSIGIIQDGEIVFSGGFGVRELGKPEKVDGDTLYMIASNSKGLTTLLLAKLVESGQVSWKDPVTKLLPQFKLGDAYTTRQVLVEHLVCACTGLPRQDMEWLLEFGGLTPEGAMETLATMQPTTRFGEMFQYSNTLAAAGGFVAGHVVYPDLELGLAYDKAMQTLVFNPLSMNSTTFDYDRALSASNHASAHSADVNGEASLAVMEVNYAAIPVRPAAAAWSSVNDLLRYIAMELEEGVLPTGKRYIAKAPLLERRIEKVPLNKDASYGMGLMVDETYGTQVVHHGGDMIGYHSDMMWLPEHNVGAVVLTNGDPGWLIRSGFQRKLLEVLFDGNQEADAAIKSSSERFFSQIRAERDLLVFPANAEQAAALGKHYSSDQLGDILVSQTGGTTVFDFGEWKSEVGSRTNPDGTVSFITTVPGMVGLEIVVGSGEENTLILRDAQHEYVFKEL